MPEPRASISPSPAAVAPRGLRTLLERHRWITFVLPLAVYMLAGSLEPAHPPRPAAEQQAGAATAERGTPQEGGNLFGLHIPFSAYPLLYTLKIGLTLAAIALVLPGYRRFPLRLSLWAIVVGVAGIVVWVSLTELGAYLRLSERLLAPIGLASAGERPAFNPFEDLAGPPALVYAFLAVRLLGLVAIVPLIEEFFLRGFLMRFVMAQDWWEVPFGKVNTAAVAVSVVMPMLTHPGELLAAAVWFGMVTCLMVKTRSIWDCVVAHSVTNLLLGVYVLWRHEWALW